MPKRFLLFVLAVLLSLSSGLTYPVSGSTPQHSRSSSSSKSKGSKASSDKTVHVNGYYRKDGTYVRSYNRRPPGSKSAGASDAGTALQKMPAPGALPTTRNSNGTIKRRAAAKEQFERETGYPHGRPGYVVDHIKPLACGGADDPSNMQWQTIEEGKAKDKTERIGCK